MRRRGTEEVVTGPTRNRITAQKAVRGFESHPLRHSSSEAADRFAGSLLGDGTDMKDAGPRTGVFTANGGDIHAAPPARVGGVLSPRLANAVAVIDGEVSQVGMPCVAASRPTLMIHAHPGVFGRLYLRIVQSSWRQQGFRQLKRKLPFPSGARRSSLPQELLDSSG
jgi:hypothetical protein